jgi:hypothetical protein
VPHRRDRRRRDRLVVAPAAAADDVPINLRSYHVFATSIKAFDETGPFDSGLSDEIFGGFRTVSVSGQIFESQSRLLGDFDAGETRNFPTTQCCLSEPNIRVNEGANWLSGVEGDSWDCKRPISAPFSVQGVFWESDTRSPCLPICQFEPVGGGPLVRTTPMTTWSGTRR